jgi:CHAD domain-containing protein
MSLDRIEPPAADDPRRRIEADLDRRIRRFASAAQRVREHKDGVALHDLRVAIRRLDVTLDLWPTELRAKPARRARRQLRKLRREVGPARTFEAELALLEQLLALESVEPARPAAAPLVARLTRRVEKGRRQAARDVASRLDPILTKLERARGSAEHPALRTTLAAAHLHTSALRREAIERIGAALREPEDSTLHDARIATRRWRYAREQLAAVTPGAEETLPLLEAQRAAGEVLELDAVGKRLLKFAARSAPDVVAALEPLREEIERRRIDRTLAWTAIAQQLLTETRTSPVAVRLPSQP